MGFSSQLDIIRSLFLRLHLMSNRKKRLSERHAVGCVGRLRSLSIPTLSSLRSWREEPAEQRRRKRRKQKRGQEQSFAVVEVIVSSGGLPSEEDEFSKFTAMHPGYLETVVVDELRDEEYGELQEDGHACLDYSGHGLFSQLQQELDSSSSSFAIIPIPGDLSSQALSDRPHEGTVESDIRRRVMRFLNIQEGEYGMVFTASKGSAFKLLGESYPFDAQSNLLTMFDYESEAVSSLQEIAQSHGAKPLTASFSFPSLSVCSAHVKSHVLSKHEENNNDVMGEEVDPMDNWGEKTKKRRKKRFAVKNEEDHGTPERKKDEQKGLFVFPVQSRVSGTKYSYQWMSLAQDNGWHVLLDASALGPKDMDSLGISLFRPDFIVTSFYKVFGSDPTGFGCLFVKNSSMSILYQSEAARSIGMVRLIPLPSTSSPSNSCRIESCGPLFKGMKGQKKLFSSMQSSKEEPIQAEVAFSGPASTFSRWKASMKGEIAMEMDACVEEINEEKESIFLNMSTGVVNCPCDDYRDHGEGILQSLTGEVEKSKTPVTPRSVLEELDHSLDGESYELSKSSSSGFATHEGDSHHSESSKTIISSRVQPLLALGSMQDTSHDCLSKKEFMTYYSHEIAGQGNSLTCKGAFSQPLISRDIRENPLLVHSEGSSYYDELEFSSSLYDEDEDEEGSEFDIKDDPFHTRREPEIYCRGLNHADSLGLNKTNDRLRFLTNWLITSMMKLQHLVSNEFVPLVHLYGPKAKSERGASLAFNLFDRRGALVQPSLVQELAHRDNISLGLGMLSHIRIPEDCADTQRNSTCSDCTLPLAAIGKPLNATELQVVTAALGFFTNFEDVYRLWAFMAKFLDTEFAQFGMKYQVL
ncbi:hypothetical protein L7F22_032504 [Adiantum nelumboides]|nr:hypothetical protein [Adiantum nelumboides]